MLPVLSKESGTSNNKGIVLVMFLIVQLSDFDCYWTLVCSFDLHLLFLLLIFTYVIFLTLTICVSSYAPSENKILKVRRKVCFAHSYLLDNPIEDT